MSSNTLELVWQMGVASLIETHHELRIPLSISQSLSKADVKELENRLSIELNGLPTVSFEDLDQNMLRISISPDSNSYAIGIESLHGSKSAAESVSSSPKLCIPNPRSHGKKLKVPRPPNAFILYRQFYHPQVKAQNPELHNNDISKILGKRWKDEPESKKDEFRAEAEAHKTKHAQKNPGYQYNPRRSSQKKRRITAKMRAESHQKLSDDWISKFSSSSESENKKEIIPYAERNSEGMKYPTLDAFLGTSRPSDTGTFSVSEDDHTVDLMFPSQNHNAIHQLNEANSQSTSSTYSQPDNNSIANNIPPHVANNVAYLNASIDFDGIQDDFNFVQGCNDGQMTELCSLAMEWPYFNPIDNSALIEFDEELSRTLDLFQ